MPRDYDAIAADLDRASPQVSRLPPSEAIEAPSHRVQMVQSSAMPLEVWPGPLADHAFYGLLGDLAKSIEPETESDIAAILLQAIVAFGSLVGRGPHVRVEGDEHHLNLFALLVGKSSKARKGTSWSRIREVYSQFTDWPRVVNGLSSGEGLKFHVRDPITKQEHNKQTGRSEEVLDDPGVDDKRLLVVESEFAQVLRQVARSGNTLSATVRAFWDTGDAMSLTKNDPITATGAHVSIIGHITTDELRAELTATDSANGFANRFLFMCVERSKLLPFGGNPLSEEVMRHVRERLKRSADRARGLRGVGMTDGARSIWQRVYPTLSQGNAGLLGAVTARAEAQCLRLALAYALADEATAIDQPHLLSALAIWERAEASARYIFGSAVGDRVADEIHRALLMAGEKGLTRTAISGLFKRHESSDRVDVALALLSQQGLAAGHQESAQRGRPSMIWRALSRERSERST